MDTRRSTPRWWRVAVGVTTAAALLCGAAQAACEDANTLVEGNSSSEALAYDEVCEPRLFRVRSESSLDLTLNMSHLNLQYVRSYPRVYSLLLGDNHIDVFQTPKDDNDMKELDLHRNAISDLSAMRFPRRLTTLDLSGNQILALGNDLPWPEAQTLSTLILDENPIETLKLGAFQALKALKQLSLAGTSLQSVANVTFPSSLVQLNLTRNVLTANSGLLANSLTSLTTLDMSSNQLEAFPIGLENSKKLVELNLATNSIATISNVRLPPNLQILNLAGNPLQTMELARSDVAILEALETLTLSTEAMLTTCANPNATQENVRGSALPVCVLSDEDFAAAYGKAVANSPSNGDGSVDRNSPNDGSSSEDSSSSSTKTVILIGAGCFGMGILVAAFIFLVRRERSAIKHNRQQYLQEPDASSAFPFATGGARHRGTDTRGTLPRTTDDDDSMADRWVFDSPVKKPHAQPVRFPQHFHGGGGPGPGPGAVAILEEDNPKRRGGSGGRSELEDLLVFEIPLSEISIRESVPMTKGNASGSAMGGLRASISGGGGSGGGNAGGLGGVVMYRAVYQNYHVVIHAWQRTLMHRKRLEREFVEQVRIASGLEHLCIVQFIGITFGAGVHKWKVAVVLEHMHFGSLAGLFQNERVRREGQQYCRDAAAVSHGPGLTATSSELFEWYPSRSSVAVGDNGLPNPDGEVAWRCKLSVALDVAMALVYLHSVGLVHGALCTDKVYMNQQGEAKLSAMDLNLALNSPETTPTHRVDNMVRESVSKARHKVMQLFSSSSITESPRGMARPSFLQSTRSIELDPNVAWTPPASSGAAYANAPGITHSQTVATASEEGDNEEARRQQAQVSGQQSDVYAFGLLLWEMDTMMTVATMKQLTAATTEQNEEHFLLRFSAECPSEIQHLARRCWHPDPVQRATAFELQEELVRLLEGRLTMASDHSMATAFRWSQRTLSAASSGGGYAMSDRSVSVVIPETEV